MLKANNYHLVTVSQLLGQRAPGSVYGSRENGPPANALHDIPASEIPSLPNTPSPPPMPNFPISDVPGQNSADRTTAARPSPNRVGFIPSHHLIASAETGAPEAPVIGRGDAENMNS